MNPYRESRRYDDPYKDYDYDEDGFPGEFLYGDDVYVDDYYMDEVWKPVEGFPDYWVSSKGRIYSLIKNNFVYGNPSGKCGHVEVSFRSDKTRHRSYMHRAVAEAFNPNPHNLPIVRHGDNNPENNCVNNLDWGTSLDNVQDCIKSGRFRYFTDEDIKAANAKRRTPIVGINLRTGEEVFYISQQEAARDLGINQSSISSVLRNKNKSVFGWYFRYAGDPIDIDINTYKYVQHGRPVLAINLESGDRHIFTNSSEAARGLGVSEASISNVLRGKQHATRGYKLLYADEEEYDE